MAVDNHIENNDAYLAKVDHSKFNDAFGIDMNELEGEAALFEVLKKLMNETELRLASAKKKMKDFTQKEEKKSAVQASDQKRRANTEWIKGGAQLASVLVSNKAHLAAYGLFVPTDNIQRQQLESSAYDIGCQGLSPTAHSMGAVLETYQDAHLAQQTSEIDRFKSQSSTKKDAMGEINSLMQQIREALNECMRKISEVQNNIR